MNLNSIIFNSPLPSYDQTNPFLRHINSSYGDGHKIPILCLKYLSSNRNVLIYFHANGEDAGSCIPLVKAFQNYFKVP